MRRGREERSEKGGEVMGRGQERENKRRRGERGGEERRREREEREGSEEKSHKCNHNRNQMYLEPKETNTGVKGEGPGVRLHLSSLCPQT